MALSSADRLRRLPFFSEAEYLELNPDVARAGIDPSNHALRHAAIENRGLFRRERLARAWGEAIVATAGVGVPIEAEPFAVPSLPISVFVSSGSDPAEVALASSLVGDLAASGARASLKDETEDPGADHGLRIVVAPHVFVETGLGPLWNQAGFMEGSLTFNTLPIQDPAFRRALPYILQSRGVLDGSPQVAHMFRAAGMPASHVLPRSPPRTRWLQNRDLDHPLVRALPAPARGLDVDPAAWDARPLDVSFFGRNTPRRAAFLRRHAAELARSPSFVYVEQGGRDTLDESIERRAHFRIAGHVGGHARITLHLAEDEFSHLDWHRCALQAMASGSVVVSDVGPPHPDFAFGVHLFREDVRHVVDLARWLLDDPDGRRAAAEARAASFAVLEGAGGALRALATMLPSAPR